MFARGDRRVGKAILRAYELGCVYDAWGDMMKYDLWVQAMEETGISLEFYNYRERSTEEILPWDFIDIGVRKQFLISEWNKAKEGVTTPNCREKCSACGAMCYKGGVCLESKN